jgi:DNA-directed RNA polymerase II subunit RPB3
LQTKLAKLVLGLKSDPTELDTLVGGDAGGAQLPPPNGTLPPTQAAAPRATGWGQEASPSEATAGTPGVAAGGAAAGGWRDVSSRWGWGYCMGRRLWFWDVAVSGGWSSNAAAGGAWGAGGSSSGWERGRPARNTTGWSSPNPQTQSGWNV